MKVLCISTQLSAKRKDEMDLHLTDFSSYFKEGEIYTVLGVTCRILPKAALFLQIKYDFGILIQIPLDLFELVDNRPSKFWRIKRFDSGTLALWPEEFYQEFFHDDLSNQEPKVWETFLKVVKKIEHEFDE